MLRKSVPFIPPPLPPSVTLSTMHTLFPFSVPPMRSRVYAHRCTRIRGLLTVLRAASMIYRGRRAPQASLETSLETVEEPSDRISRMIDRALLAGYTSPPPLLSVYSPFCRCCCLSRFRWIHSFTALFKYVWKRNSIEGSVRVVKFYRKVLIYYTRLNIFLFPIYTISHL